MATHAHRVPLSTGDGTRVSVRGTLHVVEIVARNNAGHAQTGGEPKPCQVTLTRGSPGCRVSVTAVRREAICRRAPMTFTEGGIGRSRRDLCGNTPSGRWICPLWYPVSRSGDTVYSNLFEFGGKRDDRTGNANS